MHSARHVDSHELMARQMAMASMEHLTAVEAGSHGIPLVLICHLGTARVCLTVMPHATVKQTRFTVGGY